VPHLGLLESPSRSVLLAPNKSLAVGYAQAMLGDVFISRLDLALILFALVAMKVCCLTILLHVSDGTALEAVLFSTSKALTKILDTVALQIVGDLLHALASESLAGIAAQHDLERRYHCTSCIVCRRVGITVFKGKIFDHPLQANLLVPRHHPVALVAYEDLGVDVSHDSPNRLHVEGNSLGLEVVEIVADIVAENDNRVVTLQAGDGINRLDEEVGQDLTSLCERDKAALTEAIALYSSRLWILVR
jgi:hypothetical protein